MNLLRCMNPRVFVSTAAVCLLLSPCLLHAGEGGIDLSNVIGLRVDVQGSQNCGGSNNSTQVVTDSADVTGEGDGCEIRIAITVTGSVERQNAPYDYVYVNDVLFFTGNEEGEGCAMASKTETKEITIQPGESITLTYDTSDGLYHTGAFAEITDAQVVDPDCSDCTPGSGSVENGSIHVSIKMGKTSFGRSLGSLQIRGDTPSAALATPASLQYGTGYQDVEIIRASNHLRQIKTPQALADVVTDSPYKYRIIYYSASEIGPLVGGLYDQSGKQSFTTWTVENPDTTGATVDQLRITEDRGSAPKISNYSWDAQAHGWELTTGGGLRKETKTALWDAAEENLIRTRTVRGPSNGIVSKEIKVYHDYPWGLELATTIDDPDGAALTIQRSYYDQPADGGAYKKLKQIIQPNGYWERYEYDSSGRRTKLIAQHLNAALGAPEQNSRVTATIYGQSAPQETEVVTLLGQEIQRKYATRTKSAWNHTLEERLATAPGASYFASTNLVTLTEYQPAGDFAGDIQRITHPDGTDTTYSYSVDVANGTKTTTITKANIATIRTVNKAGYQVEEEVRHLASNLVISFAFTTAFDDLGRPTRIDYPDDGTFETWDYNCCSLASRTDREGNAVFYSYDALGRLQTETRGGIATIYTYDAADRITSVTRRGTDQTEILLQSEEYDVAGRTTASGGQHGATGFTYSTGTNGESVKTTTYPDNSNRIETFAPDGSLLSLGGSAVHPRRYQYGADASGAFTKEFRIGENGSETEWVQTWRDLGGRTVRELSSNGGERTWVYNGQGQLWRETDPDGILTERIYDADGELASTRIDPTGLNRTTSYSLTYASRNGDVVQKRTTTLPGGVQEIVETTPTGRKRWSTRAGLTASSVTVLDGSGGKTVTVTQPDQTQTVSQYASNRLLSVEQKDSGGIVLTSTTYGYDAHGRAESVTDGRYGTTTSTYYAADQVASITTPAPGAGKPAQTTTFEHDSRGRMTKQVLPDGGEVLYEYWPTGELKETSGARTYPVSHTYDPQGRMRTMTTATGVTTWHYYPESGQLEKKEYSPGVFTGYEYTLAGRIQKRHWARGVTTTYGYTGAGDLASIIHSDGTPAVTIMSDAQGLPATVEHGSATYTFGYNSAGALVSTTASGGPLDGTSVTTSFDALLRREGLSASHGGTPLLQQSVGYQPATGRVATASSGQVTATYSYLPQSALVQSVAIQQQGSAPLTITSEFDNLNRLTQISSAYNGSTQTSFTYDYNSANQRTRADLADGSYWLYTYDELGQVTSGKKHWPDGTLAAGQQFSYGFDAIGNRTSTSTNGRNATWSPNTLNQYTSRQIPGGADVSGSAQPQANVTINNLPTTRQQGGYFHRALEFDNSGSAVWSLASIVGVRNNAGPNGEDAVTERSGHIFLPKTPETFSYDADGNLTRDGRWIYQWDGENRLIAVETRSDLPAVVPRQRLEFAYDWIGRRIQKIVRHHDGQQWVQTGDTRFVYDGWNLIAEIDATGSPLRTYVWGLDLSGTLQGAGGVGGLLAVTDAVTDAASGTSHYPAYDGNGNVMALVSSAGAVTARYEYGPFGEALRATGPMAEGNPFRFSTKYTDGETGLLYYGFRYYNPETGRWLSRDPIGETETLNLFSFVRNHPTVSVDIDGLREMMPYEEIGGSSRDEFWRQQNIPQNPTPPGSTSWTISPPSLSFATGQSVQFRGCLPVGGPVWLCLSGGWELRVGTCTSNGQSKTYFRTRINVEVSLQVGVSNPFQASYTKPIVETCSQCPEPGVTAPNWTVNFAARLGPAVGNCRYTAPFTGGGGSWRCTGSVSFTQFSGVSASGGGGINGDHIVLQ